MRYLGIFYDLNPWASPEKSIFFDFGQNFDVRNFCIGKAYAETVFTWELGRVSPFRFKKFFAYKRNKANLDPFHMCFTISL
jgi:hypothetical protein